MMSEKITTPIIQHTDSIIIIKLGGSVLINQYVIPEWKERHTKQKKVKNKLIKSAYNSSSSK